MSLKPAVSTIKTASHGMGLPFTQVGNNQNPPTLSFQSRGHMSVAYGLQQSTVIKTVLRNPLFHLGVTMVHKVYRGRAHFSGAWALSNRG